MHSVIGGAAFPYPLHADLSATTYVLAANADPGAPTLPLPQSSHGPGYETALPCAA